MEQSCTALEAAEQGLKLKYMFREALATLDPLSCEFQVAMRNCDGLLAHLENVDLSIVPETVKVRVVEVKTVVKFELREFCALTSDAVGARKAAADNYGKIDAPAVQPRHRRHRRSRCVLRVLQMRSLSSTRR